MDFSTLKQKLNLNIFDYQMEFKKKMFVVCGNGNNLVIINLQRNIMVLFLLMVF